MRYRGLPDRKMFNNVANADWLVVGRQQVEYPNTDRISKRFETTGVLLRTRLRKLGRLHLGATTGRCAFRVSGHWYDDSEQINGICLIEECQYMLGLKWRAESRARNERSIS